MVKKGYKQTEVGVVPEDWKILKIKDIGYLTSGESPSHFEFSTGHLPYFKVEQLNNSVKYQIDTPYHTSSSKPIDMGSIIFPKRGAAISTNKFRLLAQPSLLDTNIMALTVTNEQVHNEYLFYWFIRKGLWQIADTTSVPQINNKHILPLQFPLPPFAEQERIADALSDIDSFLTALEKQISKEKAIKQGTMQELLTGKRRLPGFSGEWRYFNLMKNSKVKARIGWQGLKKSEYLDSGYALLVTGTDFDDGRVLWDGCHYVTRSRYEQDRNIQLQNNDILITKDGSLGKAALVQGLTKPATLNSGIFVIRPLQDAYDPVFVYQILSSFVFKNFLDRLSAGSTIIHLYQKDVGKFEFLLPPTIAEQKAIAEALSEMDSDIAALENKLTKYRQVKQGMMQQLLTGKIRLKNDVEDLRQAEQANAVKTLPARTAHNRQFDDAVSIAAIVDTFYSDKYPLGRVKVQKLLYLLHRHQAASVSDFKKKAAGPYADTVRYKGGEPIAKENKYIVSESSKQGTRYFRGENMAQALNYVERWGMQADLHWLKDNFLHASRNDLELFATVDMAICDLNEAGVPISVASIKDLIASSKEWKAKLSKTYFSDRDIARAIKKCTELFN